MERERKEGVCVYALKQLTGRSRFSLYLRYLHQIGAAFQAATEEQVNFFFSKKIEAMRENK